jgi:hypothetical protein
MIPAHLPDSRKFRNQKLRTLKNDFSNEKTVPKPANPASWDGLKDLGQLR